MKRVSLLSACVLFVACGPIGADFRHGVPTAEAVRLEVPSGGGQALSGEVGQKRDAMKGQRSDFYKLTVGVTDGVNGGVAWVLGLVKAITDYPATSVQGNTAVWGPWTDDLKPTTWKLTVTRVAADKYEYKLEGKPKTADDSAYLVVLSGTHSPALDAAGNAMEHYGSGVFTLDFDASQKLPHEQGDDVGQITVDYARLDPSSETLIDVDFHQVKDDETGERVDAAYAYVKKPGQGGEFQFSVYKNTDLNTSGIEHLTIKSRWTKDGAGRADVKGTGGDIHGEGLASECWDENFNSQYLAVSWAPGVAEFNYGDEQQDCAFPTAEYADLQ